MVKNAVTTTYTYNNDNQLTAELTNGVTTAYNYDNNGNLTSKAVGGSTTTYAWDWRNMLVSVTDSAGTTVYQYDGAGNRINKTVSGVKTKYINDVGRGLTQVLMETDNAGAVQAVYTYGNDLISMYKAGANSYYHYDGLGSVRQMTNSAGAVVKSYTYDGYGNVVASSGTVANTYGFTGEQQYAEADNLVFLRARYYNVSVGRFLTPDPLGVLVDGRRNNPFAPFDRFFYNKNLYEYVKNNPTNHTDPFGLLTCLQTCNKIYKIDVGICGAEFEADCLRLNPVGAVVGYILCMHKARFDLTQCVAKCTAKDLEE
ncbi:MAG: RHS repeat-associated core domain-containing protein [Phycisphaerales bacterium]